MGKHEFLFWTKLIFKYLILGMVTWWTSNHIHPIFLYIGFMIAVYMINDDLIGPNSESGISNIYS